MVPRFASAARVASACPQESLDKPLPCIVFYHGFTSSKLVYSYFAVALAEAGFRPAVYPRCSGSRRRPGD
ncbi:esterase, partial [Klebsiella pneumoniae]|uniref:alpha/beta hydrolase n=1 Tax=Klebsiella pneumoniae TaxID=573 RepID=UPI003F7992B4|nr:esterase [Klebsiella pneumoniae]